MRKRLLEKSLDILVENAEECSALASAQRLGAEKQHESASQQYENAEKLKEMSQALIRDAAEIQEELASKP